MSANRISSQVSVRKRCFDVRNTSILYNSWDVHYKRLSRGEENV